MGILVGSESWSTRYHKKYNISYSPDQGRRCLLAEAFWQDFWRDGTDSSSARFRNVSLLHLFWRLIELTTETMSVMNIRRGRSA